MTPAIQIRAMIAAVTPKPTANFCAAVVGCLSYGNDIGVLVVTSAKTVYAEVGSAGPGGTVGAGRIESVCQEKKDFSEIRGS